MSELELGEALERMVFDSNGRVIPCYYYDIHSANFIGPEALQPAAEEQFNKLKPILDTSIKQATGAVYRCFAIDRYRVITHTFTGFFIAPNILATCAHNLYSEIGTSFHSFIVCLLQNYAIPSRAFEKYSPMTVLFEPTMTVQTEPQKNRKAQGPDFAFFHVSDYKNKSWVYPVVDPPRTGKDVITLQFNGYVAQDFIARHKRFNHENCSNERIESLIYANRLSASAGIAVAANEHFLSYSVSSAPGASGGPVFHENYDGFSAIHRGTLFEEGIEEKIYDPDIVNFGARVTQPEFVQAYNKYVVPELTKRGRLHPLAEKFLRHYNIPIPEVADDDDLPPAPF